MAPGQHPVVKRVGTSGQISLGKEFAGRTVLVESPEPGVWVIKTATTIPESELWLHQPQDCQRLDRALAHAAERPAEHSDPDGVAKTLGI
jgi:hypothetical protein